MKMIHYSGVDRDMGVSLAVKAFITIASALYQRRQLKKQQRRQQAALEAARESTLGQEIRGSGSAENNQIHYGFTSTTGIRVFVDTNNDFPTATPNTGTALFPNQSRLAFGTGTKNEYMITQTVLGKGEIDAVVNVDINDIDLDNTEYRNSIYINPDYNRANPIATAFSDRRDTTATFTQLSYSTNVFKLDRDNPQFSGVPNTRFYLRGNKIYDPTPSANQSATDRSTWTWSNNSVRVLLDYLTNGQYGPDWDLNDDLDLPSFIAAIDIAGEVGQADAPVSGKVHGQGDRTRDILRYEFNGTLNTSGSHRENIEAILDTIPGVEFFRDVTGKWKIVLPPRGTVASVQTIDESNLVGNINISYPETNDRLNEMVIRFPNASKNYAQDTITRPTGSLAAQYLTEDNDLVLSASLNSVGINNMYAAANVAQQNIASSRIPSYSFETRPTGFLLEPGDVITLRDPLLGLDEQAVVSSIQVLANLNIKVKAIRYVPTLYDFTSQSAEVIRTRPDFDFTVPAPTNVSAVWDDANRRVNITWTPNANEEAAVIEYDIQAKLGSDPVTSFTSIARTIQSNRLATHVPGSGGTYNYRVIAITRDNRRSLASAFDTVTVTDLQLSAGLTAVFDANVLVFSETDPGMFTPASHVTNLILMTGTATVPLNTTATAVSDLVNNSWAVASFEPTATTNFRVTRNAIGATDTVQFTITDYVSDADLVANIIYRDAAGVTSSFSRRINVTHAAQGTPGEAGPPSTVPGPAGPRFTTRTLYFTGTATAPSAPSATFVWETGILINITTGWSEVPPTIDAGSATAVSYSSELIFNDETGTAVNTTDVGSTPNRRLSVTGLLTVTDVSSTGTTSIDGARIDTGRINTNNVSISDATSGARIEFSGTAMIVYDSDDNIRVRIGSLT